MSDHQPTDFYNLHDPFTAYQYNLLGQAATPAPTSAYESNSYNNGTTGMSFSDSLDGSMEYNTLARAFGLSSSSSEEPFSSVVNNSLGYGKVHQLAAGDQMVKGIGENDQGVGRVSTVGGEVLAIPGPHSSISSFSGEASGGGEDCSKNKVAKGSHEDEDGDSSKKQNEQKNKNGEKRQREPRFAFMTKSEVDHLEDGYRWRKYGQKAVKNSLFPRGYYRCTAQKCIVKKRIERSFQDPSMVITTYEGQHNHPIPMTLRGSYNSPGLKFCPPGSLSPTAFNIQGGGGGGGRGGSFINPHDLLLRMPHQYYNNTLVHGSTMEYNNDSVPPGMTLSSLHQQLQQRRQQQPQVQADYGLLQDMVNPNAPFGDHKQE